MQNPDDARNARIQTICLVTLTCMAGVYLIYWLRPVLMPLVVAFFVVSGVTPILRYLEKRLPVSRVVAAGITFLGGVVMLVMFGLMIWISIVDLSSNSEDYRQRVRDLVVRVESTYPFTVALGSDADAEESQPAEAPIGRAEIEEAQDEKAAAFVDRFVRDGIAVVSQSMLSLVTTSVLVLIYVFFLLIGAPDIVKSPIAKEVDHQIRSYLSLKTIISIFTGLLFGLALRMFGVPMAFTFGVLAFLLNFVPNIGPIVASLLPIPLIVFDPNGGIVWMVSAISVIFAIQLVSGNFVEPKIMGKSSDLHPVMILLALMFWGMMWGPIGMFLATPITAAIKIILEKIDQTKLIADLMAGRWKETGTDS